MKWMLTTEVKPLSPPITFQDSILMVGSCFTENMAGYLRDYKFSVMDNPQGILFNPVSVLSCLQRITNCQSFTEKELFFYNDCYHSWDHHGEFSSPRIADCLDVINASIIQAHDYMKKAGMLVITLGSAWVYQLTEAAPLYQPDKVVANNHQAPANWFEKELLQPATIVDAFAAWLEPLLKKQPTLRVLLTVSPVRHLREGTIQNNLSKAVLLQAVHRLATLFEAVHYFPAYELVVDDLRDYRFYSEDLVHPNYQATKYVWEHWVKACVDDESRNIMAAVKDIRLAFQHLPLHPDTPRHQNFLKEYARKTADLLSAYPWLKLEEELAYFSAAQ
ncbi:MAG: GSCFA domain-containing protein [Bacteroidota bacterium]